MPDRQRETSSLRPEATPVTLETIDWEGAKLLSALFSPAAGFLLRSSGMNSTEKEWLPLSSVRFKGAFLPGLLPMIGSGGRARRFLDKFSAS